MSQEFCGKVIVLTGAASGIGRASAFAFGRRGATLIVTDVNASGLSLVAEQLRGEGIKATEIVADLTSAKEVEHLAQQASASEGRVDILFNNAGVVVAGPVDQMSLSDWEWIIGVNLWGAIRLTHALLPQMLARKSGHIINNASLAGLVGAPGMAAYSLTKSGLVGFSESLRVEASLQGVEVTLVCPGYVKTGLHAATRYRASGLEGFLQAPPRWYGLSSEEAAERIVTGVLRKESCIMMGPEKLGVFLKRLSPRLTFFAARWLAQRLGIVGDHVERA